MMYFMIMIGIGFSGLFAMAVIEMVKQGGWKLAVFIVILAIGIVGSAVTRKLGAPSYDIR